MKKKAIVVLFSLFLVITLIATPVIAATVVATDDFNRANGSLGSNWTDGSLPMVISGMRAQASGSGTAGWYTATYNSVTGTIVEGDVYHNASTTLQFVGFLMDYLDTGNNIVIVVKDNYSPPNGFDSMWVYYGLGGAPVHTWIPAQFGSPFTDAHMKVELVSGMLNITLSNINPGGGTRSYSHDLSSVLPTGGTGVGIIGYGVSQIDNFSVSVEVIEVEIDIKPCSDPNSINLRSKGVLPVGILGTADFDVTTVDPETVQLTGESGGSAYAVKWEIVDVCDHEVWDDILEEWVPVGDGYLDLLVYFSTPVLANTPVLEPGDTEAVLTGLTYSLIPIEGTDFVRIVTKGPHGPK